MEDRVGDLRGDDDAFEDDAVSRGDSTDSFHEADDDDGGHHLHHRRSHCHPGEASDADSVVEEDYSGDDHHSEDEVNYGCPDAAVPHEIGSPTASLSISEAILNDVKTTQIAAEQRSRQRTQGKTTECCVCGARALYTCPGCGRRTCSMTCVRVHKDDFSCSGVRDIAAKVPLSEFSDQQLERDFHFLEDCRRVVDNVERSFPRSSWRFTYKALPPPLHALREAARRRGVICQITSEGMRKRDANTSRLDRKTNTIVWRCEFHFVDARNPAAVVTLGTNWGSERHHLGDIMKYCWATNPPLLCYHINRQYNRASKYVGAGASGRFATEDTGAKHGTAVDDAAASTHTVAATSTAPAAAVQGSEAHDVDRAHAMDDTHDRLPERGEGEVVASSAEADDPPTPEVVPLHAYEEAPPMPPIEPVSQEEAEQQAYVNGFLKHERYVILSKAERLGNATKYFQLLPHETLNENLRLLFFVNEYPVFHVVHTSLLHRFPLVTEEDKETIRGSFRSKKTHELKEKPPMRRRSDLAAEEAERLAKVPCRRFLHSRCRLGEECPYWHCTPEEIPVCRSFLRTGQCDKGARCSFRHDAEAVRLARKRQRDDDSHSGGGRGGGGGFRGGGSNGGGRGRGGGFRGSRGPWRRVN